MLTREERRRLNYLRRVLAVQEFYQQHHVEGQPAAYVYRVLIEPRFCISLRTFRDYLGTNAKAEIKKLTKQTTDNGLPSEVF
jgi:hypothetical protein